MKIQLLGIKQGASNKTFGELGINISGITQRLTVTPGKLFLNEENDQILIRPKVHFQVENGKKENIFSIESEYMVFFRLTETDGQTPEQALSANPDIVAKLHEYSKIAAGVHLQIELNLTAIDPDMPIWEGIYAAPSPN